MMVIYDDYVAHWKIREDAAKILGDFLGAKIVVLCLADSSDPTLNRVQLWVDDVKILDKER